MSAPMSIQDLSVLLDHIFKNHSPFSNAHVARRVKYVDPHVDMRDGKVFAIAFRMFGGSDHVIHTQNECHDLKDSLFQRCVDWLNETPSIGAQT